MLRSRGEDIRRKTIGFVYSLLVGRSSMKLSILINNYNYAKYVGSAIDSALAVDWPDKEVIVADDGSTDSSREVILAYGATIVPLFLSNGGQNSACNAAFDRSTGDIIIFLDSDDVLFPSIAKTLRSAWYDGVSKVQWSLVIVDETLTPLGGCFPTYWRKPTPEAVKQMLKRTGHYPFLLGGAWARSFLSQVFPLPVREGPPRSGGCQGDYRVPNADHYLSKLAPFFGDVLCISHRDPQQAYRMHSRNSHFEGGTLEHYPDIIMEQLECARQVNDLLAGLNIPHEPIDAERGEYFMKLRLVCHRMHLNYPLRSSSLFGSLWRYWRAVRLAEAPIRHKVKYYLWSLIVAAGPRPVRLWAIRRRERRWH
jgi:glycosyltransferase involved in cell wall biosynthesis